MLSHNPREFPLLPLVAESLLAQMEPPPPARTIEEIEAEFYAELDREREARKPAARTRGDCGPSSTVLRDWRTPNQSRQDGHDDIDDLLDLLPDDEDDQP